MKDYWWFLLLPGCVLMGCLAAYTYWHVPVIGWLLSKVCVFAAVAMGIIFIISFGSEGK